MDLSVREIKQSNSAIDVAKFVLSILVVALHCDVDLNALNVLFKLPVPLFFMFSGYFLFGKIHKAQDEAEERKILKSFIIRNVKLYFFWLIIQLPLLLRQHWSYFSSSYLKGVLLFVRSILFGSTFTGSWYFSALIYGCLIVYFLSKHLKPKAVMLLCALAYIPCLLFSSYHGLVRDIYIIGFLFTAYITLFVSLVHSAPVGLFYLALTIPHSEHTYRTKPMALFTAVSFIGLIVEQMLVMHMGWVLVSDCYIMLIPTCFGIFQLLRNVNFHWKNSIMLRNLSTIIYVTHGIGITLIRPYAAQIASIGIDVNIVCFMLVTVSCICVSMIILCLERLKPLKWLRYAH